MINFSGIISIVWWRLSRKTWIRKDCEDKEEEDEFINLFCCEGSKVMVCPPMYEYDCEKHSQVFRGLALTVDNQHRKIWQSFRHR